MRRGRKSIWILVSFIAAAAVASTVGRAPLARAQTALVAGTPSLVFHVDSPGNTPLRFEVLRLLVGGFLFG